MPFLNVQMAWLFPPQQVQRLIRFPQEAQFSTQLNAIALVPMFPHTLSSRPLVIDGDSKISIRFAEHNTSQLELGCDSQIALDFSPDDIVHIEKVRTSYV